MTHIDETETSDLPGLISELGELGSGALVTELSLATLFGRTGSTIKRAVDRGELPPPVRLFGQPTWTVGALVRHIEGRLELAAKEAEDARQKFLELAI